MRLSALALIPLLSAFAAEKLLTVHKISDTFGIYDPQSGAKVVSIPVGRKPHEFGLSADGKTAFVTNYGADTYTEPPPGGNSITVIDLVQRKATGEITLGEFHRPHGIERGASGLFYVTADFPPSVIVLDGARRKIVRSIPVQGKLPHMVQLTGDEEWAFTANAGSGDVSVLSLRDGRQMGRIETGGIPMGFALTRDEKTLYVATRTNDLVFRVDVGKREVVSKLEVAGNPVRLLLSPDEKQLTTTLIAGSAIAVIDTSSFKEIRRITVGARPEGMTASPDGKFLYVSAQGDNKILKLALPGLTPALTIATENKPDPLLIWRER